MVWRLFEKILLKKAFEILIEQSDLGNLEDYYTDREIDLELIYEEINKIARKRKRKKLLYIVVFLLLILFLVCYV